MATVEFFFILELGDNINTQVRSLHCAIRLVLHWIVFCLDCGLIYAFSMVV